MSKKIVKEELRCDGCSFWRAIEMNGEPKGMCHHSSRAAVPVVNDDWWCDKWTKIVHHLDYMSLENIVPFESLCRAAWSHIQLGNNEICNSCGFMGSPHVFAKKTEKIFE